ncbi:SDR family NAD(P)-dependent oxidoreductase [Gluconacetobacter diazotrophicus]|uniref:Short-chain dehydrogenase/reductase SDR n=1 Tax=Gluconacetobacter diazotrophicus (strain ATCC 49037 / DSM 5601 / CCUG 37298 / CIP 103539 / LMG 7603 / PAl5) TaxID=272568 RepID=A9HBQ1_GLUDA|nr:SDR family NAD(P)-dependent oxidoreductase [Gluconacetobacter diazotrophicus]TWB08642.1 3-oxoacyl-[acyl-carrier protein] reductase [Gluconacetobacter diazotrophicus]CAP54842.1 conserved hypothetical protein [Gluconacetobacter diazotrophicus PA1 5]
MVQRVAVVTGGSQGTGAAIAARLLADGFDVALTFTGDGDAAQRMADGIAVTGRRVLALRADSGQVTDNSAMVARVMAEFGRIDVLVCAAGFQVPDGLPAAGLAAFLLDVAVRGTMLEAIAAADHMGRDGRMIFVAPASDVPSGVTGGPAVDAASLHGPAEAALTRFAQGLARDLGPHGITVNVVRPGPVGGVTQSGMVPPYYEAGDDLVDFVAFLASGPAGFISGATVVAERSKTDAAA